MGALIARAEAVEPKINAFPHEAFRPGAVGSQEGRGPLHEDRRAARGRWRASPAPSRTRPPSRAGARPSAPWSSRTMSTATPHRRPSASSRRAPSSMRARRHRNSPAPPITHSRLWGVTRTPWNLDYSCGGSSGGAGASLAAGSTTLANGSDIGGSIRIPSSMCGVVGFKPPYGRNPDSSPFNLDHYNHAGPMARTVADCALLQNVLSGPSSRGHRLDPARSFASPPSSRATSRAGASPTPPIWPAMTSIPMSRATPPRRPRSSAASAPRWRRSISAGRMRMSSRAARPISAPSSAPGSPRWRRRIAICSPPMPMPSPSACSK